MDNAFAQCTSFGTQVVVSANEQHTITSGYTKQRDETDDGRNTNFATGNHQSKHTTYQGQWQVEKNHRTLCRILEFGVDQQEDNHNTHERSNQQRTAGCLFAFELTSQFHVIAFGQLHFGIDAFLDIVYRTTKVTSAGIG